MFVFQSPTIAFIPVPNSSTPDGCFYAHCRPLAAVLTTAFMPAPDFSTPDHYYNSGVRNGRAICYQTR